VPNGDTHRRITLISTFPVVLTGLIAPASVFLSIYAGILTTLFVNPDADIAQRLGQLGVIIGLKAYEGEAPHRGGLRRGLWKKKGLAKYLLMSHLPLIGTLPRAFLCLIPCLILSLMAGFSIAQFAWLALWFTAGMVYSDLWHEVADILVTAFKSFWNRRSLKRDYGKK
jgi:uncharacterized metal-binding protein